MAAKKKVKRQTVRMPMDGMPGMYQGMMDDDEAPTPKGKRKRPNPKVRRR